MMPLNQASMSAVSQAEAGDAAGLYNMARNLGGSVGLALLGIFIDRRDAYHDAVIRESVTANSADRPGSHGDERRRLFSHSTATPPSRTCRPSASSPVRSTSKRR